MTAPALPDPDRLARLCGLLGSSFDGERANAASLATRELHRAGWTWETLIRRACVPVPAISVSHPPPPSAMMDDATMLRAVRSRLSALSAWEVSFTESLLAWRGRFTPKQRATLCRIYARVAGEARAWA